MRDGRVCALELELGAGLAEFGALLRRGDDGYLEDLGGAEELLRRRDDGGVLVDRGAEFLLQVADAVCRDREYWGGFPRGRDQSLLSDVQDDGVSWLVGDVLLVFGSSGWRFRSWTHSTDEPLLELPL